MQEIILSVSDCIALVNQTLEYAYPVILVEGEVASFKVSKSKYVFFDLKDDTGVLGCFMMIYQLRMPLEDGMKVRVVAAPRLTAWGKFSLTVREVRPVGEGSIKRSFELLKTKLEAEGLFDASRKRALPQLPGRIGLVASMESAGYVDFLKILNSRWGGVEVLVADVQVQGAEAAGQIIRALRHFNEMADPVETLVLVRGGGSAEDLMVFNEELLVRAVAASRIPTLVGVGHEIDISLCDLAADVRAATPSNAAQLLVPDKQSITREIDYRQRHMALRLHQRLQAAVAKVRMVADHLLAVMQKVLRARQRQVEYASNMLRQLDPKTVLRRGYSLVRTEQGRVVKGGAKDITVGERLTVELSHAILQVGVNHVSKKRTVT
jgi:exodeoxyribonuclease VII large subunit